MRCGEDNAEKDAEAADNYIGNAQERVTAAHDGAGRDQDGLGTVVLSSGENYEDALGHIKGRERGFEYSQSSMMIS
jgi:hypothetical protein